MGRHKETGVTKIIPIDHVHDPENMKRDEGENVDDLRELGMSIKNHGQINPISVRWKDEKYILLAGHRRLRAALLVGLETLEAKVFECSDEEAMMIRWDENEQRLQNNIAEEARFISEMIQAIGCTQTELSRRLGKSAAYVSQRLALLDGPEEILEAVRSGSISFDVARELLLFPTAESAIGYLRYVIESGASARLVRRWRDDALLAVSLENQVTEQESQGEPVPFKPARQILYCECCRNTFALSELVYLRICHKCEGLIKANPQVRNE